MLGKLKVFDLLKYFIGYILAVVPFRIIIFKIMVWHKTHSIVSGYRPFYDQPFAVTAFPEINVPASCLYRKAAFGTVLVFLWKFTCRIHICFAGSFISVYFDDKRVKHRKKRIVTPGEMEEIELTRQDFQAEPDLKQILIKIEEA